MQVSVRDLKAHLSEYLGRARAGEPLEVTSHRRVVARIVGVPGEAGDGVARLIASGAATWGGGKPTGARLRLASGGTPVSQLVLEDRG